MLAIAGGKGGSGKTTTALGLAGALARRGGHPLVVDCDCDMPNLHHVADVAGPGGVDALAAGSSITSVARESTAVPGVRVITAGTREDVDAALRRLSAWHGSVILDCPPGIGPEAVRPLRHASATLLVTEDQSQSIADAQTTARCARELGATPAGVIVRETAGDAGSEWPESGTPRRRVPTVQSPLAHPRLRTRWADVTTELLQQGAFRDEPTGRVGTQLPGQDHNETNGQPSRNDGNSNPAQKYQKSRKRNL